MRKQIRIADLLLVAAAVFIMTGAGTAMANEAYWVDPSNDVRLNQISVGTGELQTIRLKAEIPAEKILASFEFVFTYDSDLIKIDAVESVNESGFHIIPNTENPGTIRCVAFNPGGVSGEVTLPLFDITMEGTAEGSFSFSTTVRSFGADTHDQFVPDTSSLNVSVNTVCTAVAKFTASPTSGDAPLTVNFDTTGSSGTLRFYYGDGTEGTAANHTYTEAGTYTIILTATDDAGCTDTMTAKLYACCAEGNIQGTVTPNDVQTVIATDMKETTTQNGSYYMTHQVGSFTLTAKAEGYETFTTTVTVQEMQSTVLDITLTPVCDASAMFTMTTDGTTVTFDTTGSVGDLMFDYGDDTTGTDTTHTYTSSGDYTVTLTATVSDECTNSTTKTVNACCLEGYIEGVVTPNVSTLLTTTGSGKATTLSDGSYYMAHEAGTFTLTATAEGYETFVTSVTVNEAQTTQVNITLTPVQNIDCAGVEGGFAYTDQCGDCVGGTTGLEPCVQDCAGVYGGSAYTDGCGDCVGGTTGLEPCAQDCAGVYGGSAYIDNCGYCVGGNTGKYPCIKDCADVYGGYAYIDTCGDCVSGTTGLKPCTLDCAGVYGGSAYIDRCGDCVRGTTGLNPCVKDCAAVSGGSAYFDDCGICVGGTTGLNPCSSDCLGEYGGTAYIDSCGDCVGGNTGLNPCDPAWVTISGTVYLEGSTTTLCAMVLANGQHRFSCSGDGSYEMTVPLDANGDINLLGFADGFSTFKSTLKPWEAMNFDIHMSYASPDADSMELNPTLTPVEDSGYVKISGTVLSDETALCAMVLANGQHRFSCSGDGTYEMTVPLNDKGEVDLLGFVDGFKPFSQTLKP
ncbi:MAG: PEGA domain-containing protein [Desulfobacteraceae bacterium]|nr:PEGA domain-containing protein [Desulfobacteraceae bacterium]